jgi:hypothetical protein
LQFAIKVLPELSKNALLSNRLFVFAVEVNVGTREWLFNIVFQPYLKFPFHVQFGELLKLLHM